MVFRESQPLSSVSLRRLLGADAGLVSQLIDFVPTNEEKYSPVYKPRARYTELNESVGVSSTITVTPGGKATTKSDAVTTTLGEAIERYTMRRVLPDSALTSSTAHEIEQNGDSILSYPFLTAYNQHNRTTLFPVHPNGEQISDTVTAITTDRSPTELYLSEDAQTTTSEQDGDVVFNKHTQCKWICGQNIVSGEQVFVPAALLSATDRGADTKTRWPLTSNGLAAGPTTGLAVKNALLEVIARDAAMRTWWLKREPKYIHVSDPTVKELQDSLTQRSETIMFTSLPSPIDIPVVASIFCNSGREFPVFYMNASAALTVSDAAHDTLLGHGQNIPQMREQYYSNPDRYIHTSVTDVAIRDFVFNSLLYGCPQNTEYISRLVPDIESGKSADHFLEHQVKHKGDNDSTHTRSTEPMITSGASRTVTNGSSLLGVNESRQVARLLEHITSSGYTPIVVDVTPPEIAEYGVTVVRAFIPELIPLSVPTYPPKNHPELAGEELCPYPHPLQ